MAAACNGAAEGLAGPAAPAAAGSGSQRVEALSDEVVMSNNISAVSISRDDANVTSGALRVRGGAQVLLLLHAVSCKQCLDHTKRMAPIQTLPGLILLSTGAAQRG